jgi:hypothetical protein
MMSPTLGRRHHTGIIAAYRDQYQITTDDPRQILGPYPEPGHAGHATYLFPYPGRPHPLDPVQKHLSQ